MCNRNSNLHNSSYLCILQTGCTTFYGSWMFIKFSYVKMFQIFKRLAQGLQTRFQKELKKQSSFSCAQGNVCLTSFLNNNMPILLSNSFTKFNTYIKNISGLYPYFIMRISFKKIRLFVLSWYIDLWIYNIRKTMWFVQSSLRLLPRGEIRGSA